MQSYKSIPFCLVNQILFAHKLSRHKSNLLNIENFDRQRQAMPYRNILPRPKLVLPCRDLIMQILRHIGLN